MSQLTNTEPVWISEDTVRAVHERQLAEHGGLSGTRDIGLLQSALMRPQNFYFYHPECSLIELAACYGFGIAKNHPFVDGNKRTAYIVTRLFLMANGWDIIASREEKYSAMISLANGAWGEEAFAQWLKQNSAPRDKK